MNNRIQIKPYDSHRNYSLPEKPTIRVENYQRTGSPAQSAICAVVLSHFNLRLNGILIEQKGCTANVVIPNYFAWKKFGMADRAAAVEIPESQFVKLRRLS
ncbi:MAG: hypothetical protein IPJ49_05395 [Candidatus Obscuribacter sp.]|nr:hypothetical protein [Candidatus Obscuribacter sp.]